MDLNYQAQNKMEDQIDSYMAMGPDYGNVPMDVAEDVVMQSTPPMYWFNLDDDDRSFTYYLLRTSASYRIFLIVKLIQIRLIKLSIWLVLLDIFVTLKH